MEVSTAERPIDKTEAARFLKIHVRTMEKRLREGVLPKRLIHRNAGSVYFFESELEQFLKAS